MLIVFFKCYVEVRALNKIDIEIRRSRWNQKWIWNEFISTILPRIDYEFGSFISNEVDLMSVSVEAVSSL